MPTVWRLISRGELPKVKIGTSTRVSERAIARFIDQRERYACGVAPCYTPANPNRVGSRIRREAA